MNKFVGLNAFDNVRRVIVVAAHPDDLEQICGGTVSMLTDRGIEVFSVNCTPGDIGTKDARMNRMRLGNTRITEADAAAHILGIRQLFCLGHRGGELEPSLELRAQIARLYRLTQADTLLTFDPFWIGQIHPDHRAAGQAALDAYVPARMPLYRPEQFQEADVKLACLKHIFLFATTREPDIFIDVTPVYPEKIAACLAHTSQFPNGEADMAPIKERDKEKGRIIGVRYAESFKRLDV